MNFLKPPHIKQLLVLFSISVAIKLLLIPAYYSTDFDVHQNWLRITSQKPIRQWYFDTESKWTLDYPPLFAYFQWIIAQISKLVDPKIAQSTNKLDITVYFQRITVIISQIPFLLTLFYIFKQVNMKLIISYLSISFIILDNIHFQYNIIMQAIFLLSIYFIIKQKYLIGATTYSILLNFKHIYLYSSMAFFAYILKKYVLSPSDHKEKIINLGKVGLATVTPFIITFLPFFLIGGVEQINKIFSQLFPFTRGLIHEYWAPNFWAIYYFLDKILRILVPSLATSSIKFHMAATNQLNSLRVLPAVPPLLTTLIIVVVTLPILVKFALRKLKFHNLVFLCGMVFFLFGFHVHEKAITPYISLLFIFTSDKDQKKQYNYINAAIFVNILNLLPLLISPNEKLLRIVLLVSWIVIWCQKYKIANLLEEIILIIGCGVFTYQQFVHPFLKIEKLQFFPLMLNSVFSATFNLCWILLLYVRAVWQSEDEEVEEGQYQSIPASQISS